MSERLVFADAAPGIEVSQGTSQEDKLRSSLLIFACAFMNFAVMFWLAIYWLMGHNYSSNVPLAYQAVSISSLVFYLKTKNFKVFRLIQLSLFFICAICDAVDYRQFGIFQRRDDMGLAGAGWRGGGRRMA